MTAMSTDGGARRAASRTAIVDAAARILTDKGYAALTIDQVSAMSGVAKTTIYRHFPGKPELILGVVLDAFAPLTLTDLTPDEEMSEMVRRLVQVLGDPVTRQALLVVLAEAPQHPELFIRLRSEFIDPERRRVEDEARRSSDQWPDMVDPSLVFDVVGGAILSRLVFSDEVLDEGFVEHLVDMVRSGGKRPDRDRRPRGGGVAKPGARKD